MKVKTLIKKLSKMPSDSAVIFVNTDVFVNGAYEVTDVVDFEDGTVLLDSNHHKNHWRRGEEWQD